MKLAVKSDLFLRIEFAVLIEESRWYTVDVEVLVS